MLERLLGLVLLLAVFACAHSKGSTADISTGEYCIYDEDGAKACRRKGPRFRYGPIPYVYCSGVTPDPEEPSRHEAKARSSPCTCVDEVALAERRGFCSELP